MLNSFITGEIVIGEAETIEPELVVESVEQLAEVEPEPEPEPEIAVEPEAVPEAEPEAEAVAGPSANVHVEPAVVDEPTPEIEPKVQEVPEKLPEPEALAEPAVIIETTKQPTVEEPVAPPAVQPVPKPSVVPVAVVEDPAEGVKSVLLHCNYRSAYRKIFLSPSRSSKMPRKNVVPETTSPKFCASTKTLKVTCCAQAPSALFSRM